MHIRTTPPLLFWLVLAFCGAGDAGERVLSPCAGHGGRPHVVGSRKPHQSDAPPSGIGASVLQPKTPELLCSILALGMQLRRTSIPGSWTCWLCCSLCWLCYAGTSCRTSLRILARYQGTPLAHRLAHHMAYPIAHVIAPHLCKWPASPAVALCFQSFPWISSPHFSCFFLISC